MEKLWILLLFLAAFCETIKTFPTDDFKCSLPDVTSLSDTLDIEKFRSDFSKISEVKFPGLIGPLSEKLICKIKCIDGNWVGPLCSSTPDGRFQPVLRECTYRNGHPLLAISYKNSTIDGVAQFPHGAEISVRCRHFGRYKMRGESLLRCTNGEWTPRMPECVPTTLLTNFTGDAPPTIAYSVLSGSGVVGAEGELLVYPESSVRLDCVTPRALGDPDWTWTHSLGQHSAAWSTEDGERDTHYQLSLGKVSARHSGQYTCAAPNAHTNTVAIRVVSVSCPALSVGVGVRHHAQGTRLGHAAHFSCAPGHHLVGHAQLVCTGEGVWSGPAPHCEPTWCRPPSSLGPQLSLVEVNSSVGGRAHFACAWGYRLVGAPGIECEQDGAWSAPPPHCTPIYCPVPSIPAGGSVVGGWKERHLVGDLVSYACEAGLEPAGEPSIVCTEAGFWSHPPPFCVPPPPPMDTITLDNTTLVHLHD